MVGVTRTVPSGSAHRPVVSESADPASEFPASESIRPSGWSALQAPTTNNAVKDSVVLILSSLHVLLVEWAALDLSVIESRARLISKYSVRKSRKVALEIQSSFLPIVHFPATDGAAVDGSLSD